MNLQFFIVLTSVFIANGCKHVELSRAITYRLVKADAKSSLDVLIRRRVANVAKCMDFAESKFALSFNFEKNTTAPEPNCFLLGCAETISNIRLLNHTGVDYYSAYSSLDCQPGISNASLNCVVKVGLFFFIPEPLNFTDARAACRKLGGFLADVTSEARSRGLAAIIGPNFAFVGLSNEEAHKLWMNEHGEPLSCFDYRAWDSGEPSRSRGCVALFGSSKNEPLWRVVSCATTLPYVCEIPRLGQKIGFEN